MVDYCGHLFELGLEGFCLDFFVVQLDLLEVVLFVPETEIFEGDAHFGLVIEVGGELNGAQISGEDVLAFWDDDQRRGDIEVDVHVVALFQNADQVF